MEQIVDRLLTRKDVEKPSGVSKSTIYTLMKQNKFPRPVAIGTGVMRWRQSDVVTWQQSLAIAK